MDESPSRIPVRIVLPGVGEAPGEFIRFSAPLTFSVLMSKMPLEGRLHSQPGGYSFIVGIRRGAEKAVKRVKAGDIAYWPMQDAVVIYTSDTRPYSPVNTFGKVTENLGLFSGLRSGAKIRIERA